MYNEIDNSEHTYIEVFGEELSEKIADMYSYYNSIESPSLDTTIRPKLSPDDVFTVPNSPGATHRHLLKLSKEHPDEFMRTRTLLDEHESITEYRGGHFKGYLI